MNAFNHQCLNYSTEVRKNQHSNKNIYPGNLTEPESLQINASHYELN